MNRRNTTQRQAITEVINHATGPLRAKEIFEQAAVSVPSLGIATLYRTLKLLLHYGVVQSVELGDGELRYEAANRGHHHHFLCDTCGVAYEIQACPGGIAKLAPPGFKVEAHSITLHGLCSTCKSDKNLTSENILPVE